MTNNEMEIQLRMIFNQYFQKKNMKTLDVMQLPFFEEMDAGVEIPEKYKKRVTKFGYKLYNHKKYNISADKSTWLAKAITKVRLNLLNPNGIKETKSFVDHIKRVLGFIFSFRFLQLITVLFFVVGFPTVYVLSQYGIVVPILLLNIFYYTSHICMLLYALNCFGISLGLNAKPGIFELINHILMKQNKFRKADLQIFAVVFMESNILNKPIPKHEIIIITLMGLSSILMAISGFIVLPLSLILAAFSYHKLHKAMRNKAKLLLVTLSAIYTLFDEYKESLKKPPVPVQVKKIDNGEI